MWLLGLALGSAAMAGAGEAVYLMTGPVLPTPRSANGYSVDVRDQGDGVVVVHVETSMVPVGARGAYGDVVAGGRSAAVPIGFELPSRLRSELRRDMGSWEAATAVLSWVTENLELVDRDRRPQDAVAVLRRGGGRCSGLANATAALLLAAGFEARTVSGLLMDGRRAIPHRWVECRLPGAGWVPTDPTLGWWVVTPRHVAFDDAVDRIPEISVVGGGSDGLDGLPREGSMPVRPNLGAELVCRLDGGVGLQAVVARLQRGSDRRLAVLAPEASFGSLLPGRWLLEVEVDGRVVERRRIDLREGALHSYIVRVPGSIRREEVGS